MNIFYHLGRYFLLINQCFRRPERFSIYWRQVVKEIDLLGINSLGIVVLMSIFMGAVIALQTAYNITSPWIPVYALGFAVRESIILEFSPTVISLILAGKVGSSIASELGTMRVTEQIDALEIMGINSPGYLILPKITACILINPFLVVISMFVGIVGGWVAVVSSGGMTTDHFVYGVQYDFMSFNVVYSLIKTVVFAFMISTVSAYHGFYTTGGALEVGRASTRAVVYSSVAILLVNYVLTQLLFVR